MTIASAFSEIAVAQGGTAAKSGAKADGTELTAFVMPAHDVHAKVGR